VSRIAVFALVFGVAGLAAAQDPRPMPPPKLPVLPPPAKAAPPAPKKGDPAARDGTAKKAEPAKAAPKTDPAEAARVAELLRAEMNKKLPDPLVISDKDWGTQKAVVVRRRLGFRMWTPPAVEMVNDGLWRKYSVRIPDPDQVGVAVTELVKGEDGKANVTVVIAAERVDLHMAHQLWRNGRRLYGGETMAHCKGALEVAAEVVTRTAPKKGSFLPEVTLVVTLTDAKLHYTDVVVDKTLGFEGEQAEAVGDLAIRAVRAIAPDVEQRLKARAEAAIVKAVGTKEFKVELDKVLGGKPKK
jgi:hypothetical protein